MAQGQGSPKKFKAWWESLSPEEKRRVPHHRRHYDTLKERGETAEREREHNKTMRSRMNALKKRKAARFKLRKQKPQKVKKIKRV